MVSRKFKKYINVQKSKYTKFEGAQWGPYYRESLGPKGRACQKDLRGAIGCMARMEALNSNNVGLYLALCTYPLWTEGNKYLTNAYVVLLLVDTSICLFNPHNNFIIKYIYHLYNIVGETEHRGFK